MINKIKCLFGKHDNRKYGFYINKYFGVVREHKCARCDKVCFVRFATEKCDLCGYFHAKRDKCIECYDCKNVHPNAEEYIFHEDKLRTSCYVFLPENYDYMPGCLRDR